MKLYTAQQIRDWDKYTIENEPIAGIDLMERAATALTEWYEENLDRYRDITIVCGIGNNGGDGLVMARLLHQQGYNLKCYIVHFGDHPSDDFKENLERLPKKISCEDIREIEDIPHFSDETVIIDCIFGSGISRPPKGTTLQVIERINASHNPVISVDIASGLYTDHYSTHFQSIINADITLSIEIPKLSMLFPENEKNVGELHIVPIGLHKGYHSTTTTPYFFTTSQTVQGIYKPRKRFDHKGKYGHLLLIGGSKGMIGAVQLSTKAALRSGSGKTTVIVPACGYEIMQATCPEAMCIADPSRNHIVASTLLSPFSAIGIGPGIGKHEQTAKAIRSILEDAKVPVVIDADALNMLAENEEWWDFLPENSILTPHVGEFERLTDIHFINSFDRLEAASKMAQERKVIIVLKGANTAICLPNGHIHFNSTGNPGMAKGGSGDALLGIISGLLAQPYTPQEAAILGVYIHGKAGDYTAIDKSVEAMTTSDLIDNIGKVFLGI
ncbi:NAD(P)H-hydrate dehydratase [Flammeovirga sp. SubArs3]|uniref:NAD(P)H-hydrate dehydratase n=1 Tax=Flammeovirga sp. SubArs3 TaxID=2995316 RepID=UPI00248AB1DC|nr:NAD(P)H-hydrate dehydratase [Flammeovirga sp. SubArs3]